MNITLDHTQDLTGRDQYRLTQSYPPPDFVKTANHQQLYGDAESAPNHAYAIQSLRLYPCHTKAATWMSALFLGDKEQHLPATAAAACKEHLRKMAHYWGIEQDVTALWEKMAADRQTPEPALTDEDYALVWQDGDRKERHYPLRNGLEVKTASEWFVKHHKRLNFSDKRAIADKILKQASRHGAAIADRDLLDRCAGFGYCGKDQAVAAITKRAQLLRSRAPEYVEQVTKVAQSLEQATLEVRDHGRRIKIAEILDQLDHATGLNKLYDDGLERPEEVLFQVTEKVASDFLSSHVQTTTGAIYEKMALQSLNMSSVREQMGDDFAEAVGGDRLDMDKLAEVLPTLPRPDASMFERLARSQGIKAAAVTKAAGRMLEDADRHQLAALYRG